MIRAAVIGATGYTGAELIKILLRHSRVKIAGLTTRQPTPIPVTQIVPSLPPDTGLEIEPYSFAAIRRKADLVFLCLPHTESALTGEKFRKAGKIVIDLSADFRLRDAGAYEKWYGFSHPRPALLKESVYGLPELNRGAIRKADLIANPGCYPTGAALGVLPVLRKGWFDLSNLVIDAKSGASGAGKKLTASTQFCEVDQNFYAYKVGKHQHTPEIVQTLTAAAGRAVSVTFVPHLLPVSRGILSSIYLVPKKKMKAGSVRKAFVEYYRDEPFVRIKPEGSFPALADVRNTNYCDIGILERGGRTPVVVITAIDNLLKGASGQAVQNMNIRCAYAEESGIRAW
ncbi:MAG: N-acetyl-gamma-glutamyl-phosphate reductase [Candidatus Omnitrophota bacterium]|jgi:N-acetyl-gamma-glutamyl-phosphate reductase